MQLNVTFHAKLGTQGQRVERIRELAAQIAPLVGADPKLAQRAAVLAKADLQTEVVGEFPELQGAMGRKYALLQGEDKAVAAALEEHYKPQGPSDVVPKNPVSVAVALADKLDTLVGFWAIDESRPAEGSLCAAPCSIGRHSPAPVAGMEIPAAAAFPLGLCRVAGRPDAAQAA